MQIINLGCQVMSMNKKDKAITEIFDYLLKVASYDKSLIIRQKVRIYAHFLMTNYHQPRYLHHLLTSSAHPISSHPNPSSKVPGPNDIHLINL